MTTFFDRAAALELQQREDALANMKRFEFLPYTGHCYNCERSFDDPEFECEQGLELSNDSPAQAVEHDDIQRRFCDEFCRDDYDKRMAKEKTGWAKATR